MKKIAGLIICLLGFAASAEAASKTIRWDAYTPPADFKEFRVYRGVQNCTAQGPLAPLVIGGTAVVIPKPTSGAMPTTFTDTTIPNIDGDVCFEVTAADTSGNEGRSNRATVTVNLDPPPAVQNLRIDP